MGYFFVACTVFFTVSSQIILKWQVGMAGDLPNALSDKFFFLAELMARPWILAGLGSAFAAALCWMMALKKLPLSTAYPLTAISFVLVLVFSVILFKEPITIWKLVGTALVIAGVVIMAAKGA